MKNRIINHKSKYKYVNGIQSSCSSNYKITWHFFYPKLKIHISCDTEKMAALEGDKALASIGIEPVNILVKKK